MRRIGFNIRAHSVYDTNYLIALHRDLQPAATIVLDGLALAEQIKSVVPNGVVAHRAYGDSEAHLKWEPRDLARRYASEGYGRMGIVAYGANETAPDDQGHDWTYIINWWNELAVETEKVGVRLLMGASSSPGNISGADIDAGIWDSYLRTGDHYADWHYRQDHDYGIFPPWGGTWNGRSVFDLLDKAKVQPDRWPKAHEIDDDPDHNANWHLMRGRWLNGRAKKLGLRVPPIILSECFHDRMPDLEKQTPNVYRELERRYGTSGYAELKGHCTWASVYADWFPQWDFETALYKLLAWCDDVYPPEYLGFCLYFWCPGVSDWDIQYGYDVSHLRKLHQLLKEHKSVSTPPAELPPPKDAVPVKAKITAGYNVRAGNGTVFASRGVLAIGTEVTYYPNAATPDIDPAKQPRQWVYVEAGALKGWVALEGQFEPVVEPDPTAPPLMLGNPLSVRWRILSPFNAPRNFSQWPDKKQLHEGLDFVPLAGEPEPYEVLAMQSGVIESIGNQDNGYGRYVRIRTDWHGQTYRFWYAHMQAITAGLKVGQQVGIGETLGIMGNTGFSSEPHLHVTIAHEGRGLKGYVVDDVIDFTHLLPSQEAPQEPPAEEEPPVEEQPVDELQQRVWAALDAWIDAENQAREANQRASELGFTFRSLYAEYLSLRQETIEEAERKAA